MIRVFMSYSHESLEHKKRVLELAIRLRKDGVDARLDQFESPYPDDGWPTWSSRQIVSSSYVLAVCTERYYSSFMGLSEFGKGRGVRWEGKIIQNVLYYDYLQTGFLPLLFSREDEKYIPPILIGAGKILLKDERKTSQNGYEQLLQRLGREQDWPACLMPKANSYRGQGAIPKDASIPTSDAWRKLPRLIEIEDSLKSAALSPIRLRIFLLS